MELLEETPTASLACLRSAPGALERWSGRKSAPWLFRRSTFFSTPPKGGESCSHGSVNPQDVWIWLNLIRLDHDLAEVRAISEFHLKFREPLERQEKTSLFGGSWFPQLSEVTSPKFPEISRIHRKGISLSSRFVRQIPSVSSKLCHARP